MGYIDLPVSGGGITIYPNLAAFPASAPDGTQGVAADTNTIYIYNSSVPGWVAVATPPVGVFISDLTNDVTATGPGSAAATVQFVGGETAADVATSVQDTQAATDLSTVSTIVKRDASGQTSLDGLNLDGSTSGAISIQAANTTTSYTVKMPSAQGAASTYLQNDGSGNLAWATVTPGMVNPMTAVGDLIVGGTAGAPQRLAIGAVDKVLSSDGTTSTWQYAGLGGGSLGSGNVVLGTAKPTSIGTNNVVIGDAAGSTLATSNNIIIGQNAQGSNTWNSNIVIGNSASSTNTGVSCIVIGNLSSVNVAGNQDAIAIGNGSIPVGQKCLSIGNNSTPTRSTAVGMDIRNFSDGAALGINAGYFAFSSGCVALGQNSGGAEFACIGVTSTNNIFIGSNCTLLGYQPSTFTPVTIANSMFVGSRQAPIYDIYLGQGGSRVASASLQPVRLQPATVYGSDDDSSSQGPVADASAANAILKIAGARGRGTGTGGDIVFETAPASGSSGTTINTLVERARIKAATEIVVNDTGVDFDFRVEGDTDANLLFVDAGADRVGVGTATPATKLDVNGTAQATAMQVPNYILSPQLYDEGTETGNFTLNLANGPAQQVTINAAGPLVITLSNPVTGGAYLIKIIQGATPGTVTWPANVLWGAAGAPTLSLATGDIDIINLFYDGTDYYGTYALGF